MSMQASDVETATSSKPFEWVYGTIFGVSAMNVMMSPWMPLSVRVINYGALILICETAIVWIKSRIYLRPENHCSSPYKLSA